MTATAQPRAASFAGTPYSGFWIRALAFLLDSLVIGTIVSLVSVGRAGVLTWDQVLQVQPWRTTLETLVGLVYFTLLWSSLGGGRTIGMRLTGLRVVGLDGHPISLRAALLRWIGIVVSAAAVLIGLAWVAFDPRKQGWHDKLARTLVVHDYGGAVETATSIPDVGAQHRGVRASAAGVGLLGVTLGAVGIALAINGDRVLQPGLAILAVGLLTIVSLLGIAMTWREPVIGAAAFFTSAIGFGLAVGPWLGPWYDGLLAATAAGPAAENGYWAAAPSMAVLFLAGITLGMAGVLALAGTARRRDPLA